MSYQDKAITSNFRLSEFIESNTAKSRGIDNTPNAEVIANIEKLVKEILQPIREEYGKPIIVNSGYRCPKLNSAVGGAKTSQHLTGCAVDFRASRTTNRELFELILSLIRRGKIKTGQLIWEYGTRTEPKWIHISLPKPNKTNQILYLYSK